MALVRYRLYNGSNRYKLKSPSFSGKGSFVLGVALTVTENVSAHQDVTCFDGADGSITVAASDGTAPYVYSLDPNFSTTNSTGVFTGLSVSGTVYESTDQYGGIVVSHKTIYAKDANGMIGHVDVELKSPVELDWVGIPENMTVYCEAGENYAIINNPNPHLSTTANGADEDHTQWPADNKFYLVNNTQTIYTMSYQAYNLCYEIADETFTITVLPAVSLYENTSAHHDVTCFDGGDGSIMVDASGGVAPYLYSIDGTNWQSSPTFSNLSITAPISEGTDQYGGILICTKTIYVRDANGHTSSLDVQLKSPVELEWLNVPNDMTVYCDAGQNYATVDLSMIQPSTTANDCWINIGGKDPNNHYAAGATHTISYYCDNSCGEYATATVNITVLQS